MSFLSSLLSPCYACLKPINAPCSIAKGAAKGTAKGAARDTAKVTAKGTANNSFERFWLQCQPVFELQQVATSWLHFGL